MLPEVKKTLQRKIDEAYGHLATSLAGIRTGRASVMLFDAVKVDCYGTMMPLKQMAGLSTPDSRTVLIQPWDIAQIAAIEKAILISGLDLTPSNDGKVIRITLPQLTEARRKEMMKWVSKLGEEGKINIRSARREAIEAMKALQKSGALPEDTARHHQEEAQRLTDAAMTHIEEMIKKKEQEILEI